jgi:hypothetical protein
MSYQGDKSGKDQTNDAHKHGGPVATGQSKKFSYEEALDDAIGNLPPLGGDQQQTVKVLEVTATVGGQLPEHTLTVKVQRISP